MLRKLMKYDLKEIFKSLVPVYVAGLLLAVISRLFDVLTNQWTAFQVPGGFVLTFFIIAMIATPILTFIIGVMRYYKTMVKDEGYLTHTLPVKKTTLINSKIISSVIATISSVVVVIIAIMIRVIGIPGANEVFEVLWLAFTDILGWQFLVILGFSTLIGTTNFFIEVFTAISLGQRHKANKVGMTCVYAIAIYYINQILATVIILVPMFLNKEWWEAMNSDMPPMNILNGYMIGALLLSVAFGVVYYIINARLMKEKLNLE